MHTVKNRVPHAYEKGGGVLLQHPMHERGADSTPSRGAWTAVCAIGVGLPLDYVI